MSELQQKLARRRALNGEGGTISDASTSTETNTKPVAATPVSAPVPKTASVASKWTRPAPAPSPYAATNTTTNTTTTTTTTAKPVTKSIPDNTIQQPKPSETEHQVVVESSSAPQPSLPPNIVSTEESTSTIAPTITTEVPATETIPVTAQIIIDSEPVVDVEHKWESDSNSVVDHPSSKEDSLQDMVSTQEVVPQVTTCSHDNSQTIEFSKSVGAPDELPIRSKPEEIEHSTANMTISSPERVKSIEPAIKQTEVKSVMDSVVNDNEDIEFDLQFLRRTKSDRVSKSGQSLFDDLLSTSDDGSSVSISSRPRSLPPSAVSSIRSDTNKVTSASIAKTAKSSEEEELEALKRLVDDADDAGLDALGQLNTKGRTSSSIRIKKSFQTTEVNDIESLEFDTFHGNNLEIPGESTYNTSGRSDSISVADTLSSPGQVSLPRKRSSFNTQKTNIKSWMSTFRLDPTVTAESLFTDVNSDGGDIPDGRDTAQIAKRLLDFDVNTPNPSKRSLSPSLSDSASLNERDAMELLTGSGNSQQFNSAAVGKSIRDHLVVSSFVAMDSDSGTGVNADQQRSASLAANSSRLFSKLEGHGLFSSEEDEAQRTLSRDNSMGTGESATSQAKTLFKDSVTASVKKEKKIAEDLSYDTFIERILSPQCDSLKGVIRRFVLSILGPNGDGLTPPDKKMQVDYVFKGKTDLVRRCSDFFEAMQDHFKQHPLWKKDSEEQLICTRDHMERFVMNQIADIAFSVVEVPDEDAILSRRMQLLSFLEPEVLDIKPGLRNDMVWAIAMDELRKMNIYKTPEEKVACVVKSASILFRSLNLARAKTEDNPEESGLGADDFLPAFIYVVLKSNVPRLQSNCEFIQSYHNPDRLMSKSGYCFVNLRSAIEFVLSMDATSISIDPEYFDMKMAEGERLLASKL